MFIAIIFYDSTDISVDVSASRELAEQWLRDHYDEDPPMPEDVDPVAFFNSHAPFGVAYIKEVTVS
jgi:hypothetical protein